MFEKIWQGIESGCLIDYEYKEKSNKNTVTRRAVSLATDYEMENFERGELLGCVERVSEVAPISQTDFGGKSICGIRGGVAFAEV